MHAANRWQASLVKQFPSPPTPIWCGRTHEQYIARHVGFFMDKYLHLPCVLCNIAKHYLSSIALAPSISAFELQVRLSLVYSICLTPNTGRFYKVRPYFSRRESIVVGLVCLRVNFMSTLLVETNICLLVIKVTQVAWALISALALQNNHVVLTTYV